MTNELVINGITYEFNFGMGFIRQIDPKHQQKVNGITQNVGLYVEMAKIFDGDIVALYECLRMANKGFTPRLEQAEFDAWLDGDADIEEVMKEVEGFFANSNCCKMTYKKLMPYLQQTSTQK